MLTILGICTAMAFKTFSIASPPELRINANDASVSVTVWDRPGISVEINNPAIKLIDSLAANRLSLDVPKTKFKRVKLDVHVPRDIECDIKTGTGNIVVIGVHGRVVLAASRGGVEATGLDGKLEASTGEGKVRVQGRFDVVNVRAGFGTIDAIAATGSRMFGSWRLSAESGAILLHLPVGFNADLDAETRVGKVTSDLKVEETGTSDPGKLRGHLNAGGEPLVIRTNVGGIKVLGGK